jgi:phosphofructokinase-like protein
MKMFDPGKIKRIGVNTGGGDAPGLNAVIRAVTLAALRQGWEVFGIRHGYRGLIDTTQIMPLTKDSVRGITHLGGSILGTANRANPFGFPIQTKEGTKLQDISDAVVENFFKLGLEALVCIGGDGSLRIAQKLINKGIPIVAIPKTIDNDLMGTAISFGFDTAVSVATEAVDRLHSTAESHERVMVVEVMGRYAGWIALHAGVSGSADVILIPEIPFHIDSVCKKIMERERSGRHFSIVVCAEGAFPDGGSPYTKGQKPEGGEVLLGGIAEYVAKEITQSIGKETRSLALGHIQRGGSPTTFDRLLGLRFGSAAIRCILNGEINKMVALDPPFVKAIPIEEACSKIKIVPRDCDTILTARSLGISFGDRI